MNFDAPYLRIRNVDSGSVKQKVKRADIHLKNTAPIDINVALNITLVLLLTPAIILMTSLILFSLAGSILGCPKIMDIPTLKAIFSKIVREEEQGIAINAVGINMIYVGWLVGKSGYSHD